MLVVDCVDGFVMGIGGLFVEDGKFYNVYFILNGGWIISK